jgi:hypothetical protein
LNPVFFTDRDLGKQFPAILRGAGLAVEAHASHFKDSTPDEEWLAEVGRRGWIAISHDRRIRYKPNELEAVMTHGVALVVVVGKDPFPELARSFAASVARVASFLDRHQPPFIAKFYRASTAELGRDPLTPGRIELWHPKP